MKKCQNCKKEFEVTKDDLSFYKKINVPEPTFCPECRMQRRFAWRNNISLYNRTCELCQKEVVTIYSKESGIPVFCNKCWWNDKWNPLDYGVDYDFSKPFFKQYNELMQKVPHLAMVNDDGIASKNCEYTHDGWFSKNCYMVFYFWHVENCMYSSELTYGVKDVMDCLLIYSRAEQLYECIKCEGSFNLKYSQQASSCIDSVFLYDCKDCNNCLMCTGLRNKKYCYKNEQYSKEEYEKILESYKLDTYSDVEKAKKEFNKFILSYPRRYASLFHSTRCTGDFIIDSKNCHNCFYINNCENCKFLDKTLQMKECYDISTAGEASECYESITVDNSSRNLFGNFSVKSQNVTYCQHCHSSKYLFGCVGLKHNKYCILNKQYTKEEYEELVPKIKQQMIDIPYVDKNGIKYKYGEFYPTEISPFGYNETFAVDHFPLNKEEVIDKGFNWQDNIQKTEGKQTLQEIPDSINNIDESILNEILVCDQCNRNYKIVKNELIFYKKHSIPVPRKCFNCRTYNRVKKCNPLKLREKTCMKDGCDNKFKTAYSDSEIVYCEKCYQNEVY
ncbi:MAG: hypothetical protein U9R00_03450 [Patescibacteria group bacterium]|nr:hypothetical protein [Patescibacteria group bacterium]